MADTQANGEAQVGVHLTHDQDGFIVKVQPPKAPANVDTHHVPCDIVLVIDVSGSMNCRAPAPMYNEQGEACKEDLGLTVLDLAKHSARTILSTLSEHDRVGIVTFSSNAEILQGLKHMTNKNKESTWKIIDSLRPGSATNLWHGLLRGFKVFEESLEDARSPQRNSVRAMMVLSDGQPNHMCPPQGYVPKLLDMGRLPATIHTFGFGYDIQSGLLRAIAEVGRGSYSFIPDAGMIGTAFVHAVAHLQSTFATDCTIRVTTDNNQTSLATDLNTAHPRELERQLQDDSANVLMLYLGNLEYGQSRDIYITATPNNIDTDTAASPAPTDAEVAPGVAQLELRSDAGHTDDEWDDMQTDVASETSPARSSFTLHSSVPTAALSYTIPGSSPLPIQRHMKTTRGQVSMPLSRAEEDLHRSRATLCRLLATLYVVQPRGEYHDLEPSQVNALRRTLDPALHALPSARYPAPPESNSIFETHVADEQQHYVLANGALSADVTGQVLLSLSDPCHWQKWGRHYLSSLRGAHLRQYRNTFKDAGPQVYSSGSPLFLRRLRDLDAAFDTLPPPKPTNQSKYSVGSALPQQAPASLSGRVSAQKPGQKPQEKSLMSLFSSRQAPCIAAGSAISLANDGSSSGVSGVIAASDLRKGMRVLTPLGARSVAAVLRHSVSDQPACSLDDGRLVITPWHPIRIVLRDGDDKANEHQGDDSRDVWTHPASVCGDVGGGKDAAAAATTYSGDLHSIMLEPDSNPDAHAVKVGNVWVVTLGHGMVPGRSTTGDGEPDPRAHPYLGHRMHVERDLARLPQLGDGVVLGAGVLRDPSTGLVCGFQAPLAQSRGGK